MTYRMQTARTRKDTRREDVGTSEESLTPFQYVVTVAAGVAFFFALPYALTLFV